MKSIKNMLIRRRVLFFLWSSLLPLSSIAQQQLNKTALYEQTSELGSTIIAYQNDLRAIYDFYSPSINIPGKMYQEVTYAYPAPEQRKRLLEINQDYLKRLELFDFQSSSIYGQVDYLLLKKEISTNLSALRKEETEYLAINRYIPFAEAIYGLEKKRRRGDYLQAPAVAAQLAALVKSVDSAALLFKNNAKTDRTEIKTLDKVLKGLHTRLKGFYEFYAGYDPDFSWWVPKPYAVLDTAITHYSVLLKTKNPVLSVKAEDNYGIQGLPVGRVELVRQLKSELIPYSPEQLIQIAEKEFAYCDQELLTASKAMGFGTDWKKAQEQIKNSYVALGKQPELIVKLQDDALRFIKANNLIAIPPLAEETWSMIMMSPERQLVNPFFTGGKEISISYPTSSMNEADKLMSMRGNNPYFSRGTVQHELLPGHHLQYYMNSRYKNYRELFTTPFSIEGWPLYWELLLYDKGFAKTPEEKMGMLFWRMHRCARILFSLNYHLGKWTPKQCVDFLVDRVGHERANAEGEVRRSFQGDYSPLYQVAYMVGGLQLMALKHEMVDSGKMTYPAFHDAVLKENLIPVELIRATLTGQPLNKEFSTSWEFYDFHK